MYSGVDARVYKMFVVVIVVVWIAAKMSPSCILAR